MWELASGEPLFQLPDFGNAPSVSFFWQDGPNFSSDGQFLTGGPHFGNAMIWDAQTGTPIISVTHTIVPNNGVHDTILLNERNQCDHLGLDGIF